MHYLMRWAITALMPGQVDDRNSVSPHQCTSAPGRLHIEAIGQSAPGIARNLEAARQSLQRCQLEH